MGLSDTERHAALPGVEQESMVPVFGQCAVMISPLSSSMSAKKRLYLFIRVPRSSGVVNCMINEFRGQKLRVVISYTDRNYSGKW